MQTQFMYSKAKQSITETLNSRESQK